MKTYFVKVSWTDPNQPLTRMHRNDKLELDLTADWYATWTRAKQDVIGWRANEACDFTIDFMIEVPNS